MRDSGHGDVGVGDAAFVHYVARWHGTLAGARGSPGSTVTVCEGRTHHPPTRTALTISSRCSGWLVLGMGATSSPSWRSQLSGANTPCAVARVPAARGR